LPEAGRKVQKAGKVKDVLILGIEEVEATGAEIEEAVEIEEARAEKEEHKVAEQAEEEEDKFS
jgi:hypothetical protein